MVIFLIYIIIFMEKKTRQEYKKIMLFDAYAGWTLAFSIVATLAFIFGMIYVGAYDQNKTFADQLGGDWFVIFTGMLIIFTMALFIVNCVLASLEAKRAAKNESKLGMAMYIVSIFIPFVGFGYHIDTRRTLMFVGNRLYMGEE